MALNKIILKKIYNVILVVIGSIIASFAGIAFLNPLDINSGGVSGIGVIVRYFIEGEVLKDLVYDIVTTVLIIILWLIGLIFLGKDFAYKTLLASLVCPLANFFFTFCPGVRETIKELSDVVTTFPSNSISAGNYIICGLFGGLLMGTGIAITFLGGGSTGGIDVLMLILAKYLHIKQSIISFILDGSIIVIGILILCPNDPLLLFPCLIGVLSSITCAVLIELIYISSQTHYQVDIISDKWEEISRFSQTILNRSTTIIHAQGGSHGSDKIILRIVFDKRQYAYLRNYIAKIDPQAFVTFTQISAVTGKKFKTNVENNASENDK